MYYKQKLFLNFIAIFTVFTLLFVLFQYNREKTYKMDLLKSNLSVYATLLSHSVDEHAETNALFLDSVPFTDLLNVMPEQLRVTVIKKDGNVIFDNVAFDEHFPMENHIGRPEIQEALFKQWGYSVRTSGTTLQTYYYYAAFFKTFYVRVALPFDMDMDMLLQVNNLYIYVILLLFFAGFFCIMYVSDKFGGSLIALRNFALSPRDQYEFPKGELGDIGRKLKENYYVIKKSEERITHEQERIKLHFVHSSTGVAFFTRTHALEFSNSKFVNYLNLLSDEPLSTFVSLPMWDAFHPVHEFLQKSTRKGEVATYEYTVNKNQHYFQIRVLHFADGSYECILQDITATEKTRTMKQEITGNIAHELRTPLSSISGYLETILTQEDISEDIRRRFIERSFQQAKRLTALIRDISLITKMDESNTSLTCDTIDLQALVENLCSEYEGKMREKQVTLWNHLSIPTLIYGNDTLLNSVFSNLIDNALNYAGANVEIHIEQYFEDEHFYYFSVWDTGKGVEEGSVLRLFDRFYRPTVGRTRMDGGSGLGLSIVKHAVQFHQGEVSAKNRPNAGLEISFSLKKRST